MCKCKLVTEHNSGQTLILRRRLLVTNIFQPPRSSCSFRLYISPSLWIFVKRTWVMRTEWGETFRRGPARPGKPRPWPSGPRPILVVITWEPEEDIFPVLPLTHETIRAKRFAGCPRHFVTPALIFCFHDSG